MVRTHYKILCLASLSLSMLSGCGNSPAECLLDYDGPVIDKTSIANPVLNQVYSEKIRVSIKNEPQDDRFSYNFEVTGALPAGLSTVQQGRDLLFQGTPTELGTFSFNVSYEVEDSNNAANTDLCYTAQTRIYEITVQQGS